ncbi:MAG: DUF4173 domain-containing protein, partial [Solirubrobacteraceae bacterium]|nr:DUF4173 domain-containing protein [Solirubrobacteraceae bacterium]
MTAPTFTPPSGVRPPLPASGPAAAGAPTGAGYGPPPTFVRPGGMPVGAPVGTPVGTPGAPAGGPAGPPAGGTGPGGPAGPAGPAFVKPTLYDGPPAPRAFALAALGLALFTGLLLAEQPAGVGLAALCLGLIAAAWTLTERRGPFVVGALVGAAALGVVPAFRDSEWVTTLSMLGSLTLTSIAVAGAKTWRETAIGVFAWVAKLIPAPVVFMADGIKRASSRRWSLAGPVARGVAMASLLVLVFGALFSAADADFAELVRTLFDWNLDVQSIVLRTLLFGLVLTIAGALWLVSATRKDRPAREASTRLGRTEWTIALGAAVTVFVGFVALQLPAFFGGDDVVQLTAGLTYAENARTGFLQLTVAAMLTLGVVAAAKHFGPSDDLAVRIMSGVLCLLTVVVLASALHRLGLYTDAYGETRTRFSLESLMLWLGAVLLLVVAAGGLGRTSRLPRAIVLVSAVFAVGTVAMNPDARVAERNADRFALTGTIDPDYLSTLSADALPSLERLPDPLEACIAQRIAVRTLGAGATEPTLDTGSDPL